MTAAIQWYLPQNAGPQGWLHFQLADACVKKGHHEVKHMERHGTSPSARAQKVPTPNPTAQGYFYEERTGIFKPFRVFSELGL